ncbi:MAG: hypothetical protein Fur0020_04010 [Thermodesulfovibrionia bacterium]
MPRPLQCPYCGNYLIRPLDIKIKSVEITGGICRCGAIYVLDRTGHAVGEIFLDALTFLCSGDIDKALSLNPDDYDDMIYNYDYESNSLDAKGRTGKIGKIIFMKLKQQFK